MVKPKTKLLPDGPEEKLKGKGLSTKDWVEQKRVLAHPAVGAFPFPGHCGWNLDLESLSTEDPLLALATKTKEPMSANEVVDDLNAGLRSKWKAHQDGQHYQYNGRQ